MRRRTAEIDRDIEHRARRYAHQLSLRLPNLIMQPAQHAPGRPAVIVLHPWAGNAGCLKRPGVPAFHEEAAIVAEHLWFDDDDAGQIGFDEIHSTAPPSSRRSR